MSFESILLNKKSRLKLLFALWCAIGFFYGVFRPFQMAHYHFQTFLFVWAAYVLLSGIFLVLFLVLFPKYLPRNYDALVDSKKGRSLFVAALVVSIGCSFFLFKIALGFYEFNLIHVSTGALALGAFLVIPLGFL